MKARQALTTVTPWTLEEDERRVYRLTKNECSRSGDGEVYANDCEEEELVWRVEKKIRQVHDATCDTSLDS
jgi:hypothetical protein